MNPLDPNAIPPDGLPAGEALPEPKPWHKPPQQQQNDNGSTYADGSGAVDAGASLGGDLVSGAGDLVAGAADAAGEVAGAALEGAGSALEAAGGCLDGCGGCSLAILATLFAAAGTAMAVLR